jgi:tRNA modification GTPase
MCWSSRAHGGPVVLQLLLARCLEAAAENDSQHRPRLVGLRVAAPGEFSQRAFLNGKIDLAQAEAIADLIDASTEAAARSASRSLAGEFSREIHALRDALVHLRMLVEATLDFPEEEIDFLQQSDAAGQLHRLQETLARVLQRTRQGALLREGIRVVIAGQPNAGKSSLLNALAGAELAIVTPVAGTTRDIVSGAIQIEGVPLHVIDTAGLRESDDPVEKIGIDRAWEQIAQADAVLFLHDLTRQETCEYRAADAAIEGLLAECLPASVPVLHVWNKSDVAAGAITDKAAPREHGLRLSARTGEGLQHCGRTCSRWRAGRLRPRAATSRANATWRRCAASRATWRGARAHRARRERPGPACRELRLAQNALGEITASSAPTTCSASSSRAFALKVTASPVGGGTAVAADRRNWLHATFRSCANFSLSCCTRFVLARAMCCSVSSTAWRASPRPIASAIAWCSSQMAERCLDSR